MASTYSDILRLTLPTTGELSGTWGTTVNTGVTALIESALSGTAAVTHDDSANYTLTTVNGAADEAREMFLNITGTLGAARNVVCPTKSKLYFVRNATTGGFAFTLKTAAGTGISVPNGKYMALYCDGTNVVDAENHFSAITLGTDLAVADGGTGRSTGTTAYALVATGTTATGAQQTLASGATTEVLVGGGASALPVWTTATGSGAPVRATTPTLVTPILGTPASGTVTNLTGTASININGTVGATTPGTGAFTTLSSTGNTTLGDATTDTVTVNGYMGMGGAGSANMGLWLRNNALTSTNQYGAYLQPTSTSAATASISSAVAAPKTAAAAFTTANAIGFRAIDASKGAGSTITSQHGVYVEDQTQGTNNYGITSLVSSGANKWNIYASGTAANYFAGNVGIGVTPTAGINASLQIKDGIGFPATQVASTDANTLDDYEEGTFTPTIVGTTVAGTGTYSTQVGRYTKIGNIVRFTVALVWSAHTGTGNMRISGLPFTSNSTTSNEPPLAVLASNLTFSGQISAAVLNNTTQARIWSVATGAAAVEVPIDTAATIIVSGTYEV